MLQLRPDECRVLGVLVEKAHTTASQYPMSLNAITAGCNQKSNRHPVVHFDEDRAVRALDALRDKHVVVFAETLGSRVMKFRHTARETLQVGTSELVVLAELMLRGPQTAGEIRTRASRMHALGTLDELRGLLDHMMAGDEPSVRQIPPAPGSRAPRYAQLLCPDLHPLDDSPGAFAPAAPAADAALAERVEQLTAEVADLRRIVEHLARALGETDLLADDEGE